MENGKIQISYKAFEFLFRNWPKNTMKGQNKSKGEYLIGIFSHCKNFPIL